MHLPFIKNSEVRTMPNFKTGEMFQVPGFKIVTTNSFLTNKKKLVMGRGAACQLKMKVPGIDKIFGEMIHETCGHLGRYGLLFNGKYGAFQVKYRFDEKADLDLIKFSMEILTWVAQRDRYIYSINFPGIGNGKLEKDDVKPLLDILPDNVYVWEKKEVR